MTLELLSLLCTFENSTKCTKISFYSDSFSLVDPEISLKSCMKLTNPSFM